MPRFPATRGRMGPCPASRSYEGRRRRHGAAGASLDFASSGSRWGGRPTDGVAGQPEPRYPETAGHIRLFPASGASREEGPPPCNARPGGQTAVWQRRRASMTERGSGFAGAEGAARPAGRATQGAQHSSLLSRRCRARAEADLEPRLPCSSPEAGPTTPVCNNGGLIAVGTGLRWSLDPPPAQIPACTASALGSSLGYERRSGRQARDGRSSVTVAIVRGGTASVSTSSGRAGCGAEAPGTSARWRSSGRRAVPRCCRARRSSWRARAGRWRASVPARGWAGGGVASARP